MAERFYDINVAGCQRRLPICDISEKLAIAAFIMLGDVELTDRCADALAPLVPKDTEVIMTAETKGIPIAAALARRLGMGHYVVARKSVKGYMKNPISVEDESITTKGKQRLCLMDDDISRIRGSKVLLTDDLISTGGSMKAMRKLAELAGGVVIGEACVLAEGDATKRTDIIYLEKLPLFDAEACDTRR